MQGSFLDFKSRRTRLVLLFSTLLVLTLFLAAALPPTSSATQEKTPNPSQKRSRPEFVPGQVLVRYRSERTANQNTLKTLASSDGRQLSIQLERFDGADIVPGLRLAHVAPEDTMAAIAALKAQPDVLYAEPNYILHLDLTPNDPRFTSGELYGLTKIGAPTAWNTTTGNSAVVVGVIDEGIDKLHPDLAANIWVNPAEIPGNGIDDDGNGFIDDVNGYNFAGNTGTIPAENHATHVGGTIGAVGNNGVGVVGVNWQVRLMSLKFIGGSSGSTSDAIRASNYAKQMHDLWISSGGTKGANIRVLNNSYGGGSFSQSFLDAILGLNQSGILFVAAAGNAPDSPEPNNDIVPHYPSSYDAPNVIGVAATDSADALPSFSHYGATSVHLGAPGVGILSTTTGNTYSFFNGTSMATPHVAGSAALLLAQNPNLTVQQLKSLLIFNGDPVASLNGKTITGRRLSIANSMQTLAGNDTTPPGTVTSFQINTQTGRSLNLGWISSGDDGAVGQASLYQVSFTDGSTGAIINLKSVIPTASGVTQALDVKLPYRHTSGTLTLREFDNSGNEGVPATLPVSVSLVEGDPYLTSLGSPAALSTGGTPLALVADDGLKLNYALPFAFPFFGQNFSTVNISTNGNLFFSAPPTRANGDADDVPSLAVGLTKFKMISGLWDDLRTDRRIGDDVYVVTPDPTRIIFRWSGVTFGDGTPATEFPVNFEIELRGNGTILTRYGAGQSAPINTNLFPVVGISGGEPEAYVIASHTSEDVFKSLTNAQQVTFLPRSLTNALTVASVNPASGVSITVSPSDAADQGNGTTQFTRSYLANTVVNLTAPALVGNNRFQKWQRDGVDFSNNAATSVTMDAAHTMTAVYLTGRTLTVASSNPNSGVNITVTPNDNNSLSNGITQFTRLYDDASSVNLTAPATAAGNNFRKWQLDGADVFTNPIIVTMGTNHTVTAVYVTPRTLTVASTNPASGVSITVTPNDIGGFGNGATQFTRTYDDGANVSLTAPATAGGNNFQKWQRDGVDLTTNAITNVTMDAAHTMTAVYVTPRTLTVASLNPSSGVSITVSPNDNNSAGNGSTLFTRTYNEGSIVSLTAPASAGGNVFLKWQRDGVDFSVNAATSVPIDSVNRTLTAVYDTARTLTVSSANPGSGVGITVSPNDNNNLSNGTTQFTRIYAQGSLVSLTAPASAGGNIFQKWQRDGVDFATSAATSVMIDQNRTLTAVYVAPQTLTVASVNPASGVSITVSPNDGLGLGSGTTQFTRNYLPSTVVNLTAPAMAAGNNFVKWQRDGADFSVNAATSVTMDANHTMTAVYVTPRTLTVASVNPNSGASITVSPNDNNSLGNGTTQFTRTYNDGTVVNLTAPATAGGNIFQKWQRDGVDFSNNAATSVTIDSNRTMTAVYVNFVQFSLPQFDVFEDLVMSGGSAMVTVTRSGNTSAPASVDYATSDGSATQKGDYTLAAGTLNFAAGESSKTFPILIIDDVYQEGTEGFSVTLSNPLGTTLGVRSVTTVRIFDNDLSTGTNPLDNANAQFFVRQHYLDFFSREPDSGGLSFWSNQITECNNVPLPGGFTDAQQCREIRRINVSAAFFLSIEFQETGYLVERFYKSAYGDATGTSTFGGTHTLPVPVVRYVEFLRDTQQIGRGVVVGQTGWELQLENNKVAFALDFVTRTRFSSAYATTLSPTDFVNQLFVKAGVTPTAQQLQDAINEFGGAGNTADTAARGRALRRVAEHPSLNSAEKNKAFVLLQFIGYLRRDPNSGPDTDYTGYDFWLSKLNQFNGNFVNAEMVKAFLVSGEYRGRFGPP